MLLSTSIDPPADHWFGITLRRTSSSCYAMDLFSLKRPIRFLVLAEIDVNIAAYRRQARTNAQSHQRTPGYLSV